MTATTLRLKWQPTSRHSRDPKDDFTAAIDGHTLRIYRDETSPAYAGQFRWVANRERFLGSGHAATAREAALAAERCYFGEG